MRITFSQNYLTLPVVLEDWKKQKYRIIFIPVTFNLFLHLLVSLHVFFFCFLFFVVFFAVYARLILFLVNHFSKITSHGDFNNFFNNVNSSRWYPYIKIIVLNINTFGAFCLCTITNGSSFQFSQTQWYG